MPYTIHAAKAAIKDGQQHWRDIDVFASNKDKALEAIGQDNTSGARGAALTAINNAKNKATSDIQAIVNTLNTNTSNQLTDASAVANMIAQHFDQNNAYENGTYVRYTTTNNNTTINKLYRLTADHTAGVTWENTSKVEVEIGDQINDLKSAITETTRNLFDKYNPNSIDATFASASGGYKITENPTNKMIIFPVTPGKTYTISKISSSRFRYGTFAALPAIGTTTNQTQTNLDTLTSKTITMRENDNYLAVLYYNSTTDTTITPEEILDTLQIEENITSTAYTQHLSAIDSEARNGVTDVTNQLSNINESIADITSRTKNLFNWQDASIFDGNIAKSGNNYIITTGTYKLFYMPVESGKWYTIQKVSSYRFRYGVSTSIPTISTVFTQQSIANDSATAKSVYIKDGEVYLTVMYYSPSNDTLTENEILKTIMVEEGQNATNYIPYYTAKDEIARQTISNAVGGNLFAMFDNITCIGDSLTYSEVFTGENAHRQAKRTYPEVLAALSGNTAYNLGLMGDSASDWWGHKASEIVAKENQLFIVYLGTNGGLDDTISTDCPGTDISNYASNNTGCYGKILQTIANLGDRALLVHIYGGGGAFGVEGTNAVIDKFGERYGFAVVDNEKLLDNCYHTWPDRTGMNNLHYNDLGYAVFAGRLIAAVNALEPDEAIKLVPHD